MWPEPPIKLSLRVICCKITIQSKAMRLQRLLQWSMKSNSMSLRDFFFSKCMDISKEKENGLLRFQNSWLKAQIANKRIYMSVLKEKNPIIFCCTKQIYWKLNISLSLCIAELHWVNSLLHWLSLMKVRALFEKENACENWNWDIWKIQRSLGLQCFLSLFCLGKATTPLLCWGCPSCLSNLREEGRNW